MAVFTTPILDDFNRANEAPLSLAAGWDPARWHSVVNANDNSLGVSSNMGYHPSGAYNPVSAASQLRSNAASSINQEVYFTASWQPAATVGLIARGAFVGQGYMGRVGAGGGSPNGRYVDILAVTNYRLSAGRSLAYLDLSSTSIGVLPSSGVPIGFRVYGVDPVICEMWTFVGGVWKQCVKVLDTDPAQIRGAGRIGLLLESGFTGNPPTGDNFGGGDGISPTTINDIYPNYTGTQLDTLSRRAWPEPKANVVTKPRPQAGQIWPRRR